MDCTLFLVDLSLVIRYGTAELRVMPIELQAAVLRQHQAESCRLLEASAAALNQHREQMERAWRQIATSMNALSHQSAAVDNQQTNGAISG